MRYNYDVFPPSLLTAHKNLPSIIPSPLLSQNQYTDFHLISLYTIKDTINILTLTQKRENRFLHSLSYLLLFIHLHILVSLHIRYELDMNIFF